ncbi:MAG: NAD(P)H-dependent glycerol-3-phosphate dehydrogenase [Gemmatimonadaceae bacterium]
MNCAVLGAGAWGASLADRLARNGHSVRIWAYEPEVADSINSSHTNRFLDGISLAPSLTASSEIRDVVTGAEFVVLVAPSHVTRAVAEAAQPYLRREAVVVVASKGIEQHTLARMSQIAADVFDRGGVVALSGPTFAAEVVRGQPTAIVAACADLAIAERVQRLFHVPAFRVYTQHDIVGVELGGAVKNVMALATGVAEGLELGFNARAALITRGLAEMTRLGVALGADPATFAGLAGVGDLVLTCTGLLSRNRALGVEIGRGKTLDEALTGRETVAEGVITTRSAKALSDRVGVTMPIVDAAFSVLFEGQSPRDAIVELMNRDPRPERDD